MPVTWIMLNSRCFYCWSGIAQQWGKGRLQDGGNLRLLQARVETHLCFLPATSVVLLQTAFSKYQCWKGLGFRWATLHTVSLIVNPFHQLPQFPSEKFHFLSSSLLISWFPLFLAFLFPLCLPCLPLKIRFFTLLKALYILKVFDFTIMS